MIKPKLSPIIKWPGGKSQELPQLIPYFPSHFDNFYEPFLGGGACYFAVDFKHAYVNDRCEDLISFYTAIKNKNNRFFEYFKHLTSAWDDIKNWITKNSKNIIETYKKNQLDEINLLLTSDKGRFNSVMKEFNSKHLESYFSLLEKSLVKKLRRMKKLESQKGNLSDIDTLANIESALKAGLYNHVRYIYNSKPSSLLKVVAFAFLRDYCYSGMFRYSKAGKFNVPYGGISYNSRSPDSKVNSWQNPDLLSHFAKTTFVAEDFENFIKQYEPQPNDFVFLDPPYDTDFSTYAGNPFEKKDQERLANWLINECQAKWLLVIKNTDFIYNLYSNADLSIDSFDKRYTVSFKNRNNPDCEHLIISNRNKYELIIPDTKSLQNGGCDPVHTPCSIK